MGQYDYMDPRQTNLGGGAYGTGSILGDGGSAGSAIDNSLDPSQMPLGGGQSYIGVGNSTNSTFNKPLGTFTMSDGQSTASGAIKGAGAGAVAGSVVPGIGTAVGAVAGGLLGAAGGFFGGSGDTQQGYQLPQELEYRMLQDSHRNLQQITQDYQRSNAAYDLYNQRIQTLQSAMDSTIPSNQAIAQLRDNTLNLATTLGQSATDLVKNGFIDQHDVDDLQHLQDLGKQNFEDPAYQQQIKDQRAQLEQGLARDGASAATRAQALTKFDQDSKAGAFSHNQELINNEYARTTGTIQTRSGLRQSGLESALQSYNVGQNELGSITNQIGASGNLAGQAVQSTNMQNQTNAGFRQENQASYDAIGKYNLSQRANDFLYSGAFGASNVRAADGRIADRQKIANQKQAANDARGVASGNGFSRNSSNQ